MLSPFEMNWKGITNGYLIGFTQESNQINFREVPLKDEDHTYKCFVSNVTKIQFLVLSSNFINVIDDMGDIYYIKIKDISQNDGMPCKGRIYYSLLYQ